jgi:hypothetical protein
VSYPVSSFSPQWSQFVPVLEFLFLTILFSFLTESVMEFLAQLVNVRSLTNMATSLTGAISGLMKMAKGQYGAAKQAVGAIRGGGKKQR